MSTKHPGGVPDFIEMWGPEPFRRTGYGLVVATAASIVLSAVHEFNHLVPLLLGGLTGGYWAVGIRDLQQEHQALRRNFPVLIHIRYLMESIRPEIQQYFIQPDDLPVPYSREMRSIIYQRSKGLADTRALGTKRDVYKEGHEWAAHSLFPVHVDTASAGRVRVGGPECAQPYDASLLNISAMSYGALSATAIEALNRGAAISGCYHNTGEGGISRFHKAGGGDLVWNVGTGYFACGSNVPGSSERRFDPELFRENSNLPAVRMIEIKLSQGAKPAHGGVLPAAKITADIADARGLGPPPWESCNSPPRHSAFTTPHECMRFVQRLRELSGGKPVGLKLCVGQPHELAALVHAMVDSGVAPDFLTIDGAEGGTGAAPLEFQNSLGFPLVEGLRLADALLVGANLRHHVKLIGSGKVYNGFSLVRTLAHGADLTNAARAFMFSLGCIQALKCNSNTCPTGITTQDAALMGGLHVPSKSERVANFHKATVEAALEIVGALGVESPSEVSPKHLYRREQGLHIKNFSELEEEHFPSLTQPGILLHDPHLAPPKLREWWAEGGELHRSMRGGASGTRDRRPSAKTAPGPPPPPLSDPALRRATGWWPSFDQPSARP